jgi:hypothetical protein
MDFNEMGRCTLLKALTSAGAPRIRVFIAAGCAVAIAAFAQAQEHGLIYAKDGSGVFGYKDTPVQPWSGYHVHDPDRPAPKKVDPGGFSAGVGKPPSDAIVLFDGKDLSKWKPNQWRVVGGYLVATTGPFETVEEFGSYQLHLEWQAPEAEEENIMNRGNNGVFLMGLFEVQIFDPRTKIYPDGQAASIYGQTPPLVNACRKPPEWETYDIVFSAPEFKGDKLEKPPRVTMLHNGVLVHHAQEIYGATGHRTLPGPLPIGKTRGPLALGAHQCPVRFRNIWLRPLEN